MDHWIVRNDWKYLPSFIICVVQAIIALPKSWRKHFTSFMNKICAATYAHFFLLSFVNICPALCTSGYKFIIIFWWLFWNIISCDFLTFFCLNVKNLFSTVRASLIEFPPTFSTLCATKLMFTVQSNMIRIHFIQAYSTHLYCTYCWFWLGSWTIGWVAWWFRWDWLIVLVGSSLHEISKK